MKAILGLLVLLVSTPAVADDYYEPRINTYDSVTGLYYKAIVENPERGFLSSKIYKPPVNVAIYDPSKDSSVLLLKEPQKDGISLVLFETGFKDGIIEFNGPSSSSIVMNNTRVQKREPKDKILVCVHTDESKETVIFVADKKGSGLRKVTTVPQAAEWHLDVRNSKLRVVRQTVTGIQVESFEW
jgi:hypothetical protein